MTTYRQRIRAANKARGIYKQNLQAIIDGEWQNINGNFYGGSNNGLSTEINDRAMYLLHYLQQKKEVPQ